MKSPCVKACLRGAAAVASAVVTALLTGCATGPAYSVSANVSQPVPADAEKTFYFEAINPAVLQLVAPHHEKLRAALEQHGYREVPQGMAQFVVTVHAVQGAPTEAVFGPAPASGVHNLRDQERYSSLLAMIPNRYQALMLEDRNGPPDFMQGPNGELVATGLARAPGETESYSGDELAYLTILALEVDDADPGVPAEQRTPRCQVVVIGEASEIAEAVPLTDLFAVAASYLGQSTRGEIIVRPATPDET